VTVESPDGERKSISLDAIATPENYGTYPIRDRNGPTKSVTIADGNGISVRQILEDLELEFGYGTVRIKRPNGTTLELDSDDVKHPNYSPTIYIDESGQLWFLRPSTGTDDFNAADHFRITAPSVELTQTPPTLGVSVKASRKKIDAGESITFTAKVADGPLNAEYTYEWNFNDGERIPGGNAEETHKFVKAGTFEVMVSVKVIGESRSDSDVVEVQVGEEKESDKDRQGGGDNSTGTEDSGTATGDSGGGSTYGGGSSGYSPSYTPPTPAPYTPAPPAPAPSTPTPTPVPSPPGIATDGSFVEGNLLADAGDPPSGSILESAARAARDGKQRDSDESGGDIPEAALSLAGALALLGLGAGLEARQGRPLRLRLPRRAG
jgi:hypothetical protein